MIKCLQSISTTPQIKGSLARYILWLNIICTKMLIQKRESLEKKNLRWNPSEKKYKFLFDLSESDAYTFTESVYLGKEKSCLPKNPDTPTDLIREQTIINNLRIKNEYSPETNAKISLLLNQVISSDSVLIFINIE